MRNQWNSVNPSADVARASASKVHPHPSPPPLPTTASNTKPATNSRPRRPNQQNNPRRAVPSTHTIATALSPPPSAVAGKALPPAASRSRSPIFWGATADAPLYSGPLGEIVGVVPQGSVLLEASRYRDAFGGWWLSTRCDDGSLGWIAYGDDDSNNNRSADESAADGSTAESSPLWQRLYDTRATPAPKQPAANENGKAAADLPSSPELNACLPDTSADWGSDFPHLDVAAIAECEAKHFLFQDEVLFQYYWNSVYREGDHRDWNSEYQRAVEAYRMVPQLSVPLDGDANVSTAAARKSLSNLLADFRQAVDESVMRVCAEAVVPLAQRCVPCFPQHPNEVFFINGILIKRCVDNADGDFGGDDLADKLGNAVYRNGEIIALEAPSHFLYTPLQARCRFGGHSFLCSSIPPYGTRNLISASVCPPNNIKMNRSPDSVTEATTGSKLLDVSGGAHHIAPSSPPLVQELLQDLGHALRLQDGVVPWEWRVYAGWDRRLYLSHTARLLPPVLPLAREKDKGGQVSASTSATNATTTQPKVVNAGGVRLYASIVRSRVRPEVFYNWPAEWKANECCSVAAPAAEQQQQQQWRAKTAAASSSTAVGQWIRADGITQVAGVISFHWPLSAPPMPTASCNACASSIDSNEIRFVVCANTSQCCRICIQCYARLLAESDEIAKEREPLSRTCTAAVKCGAGCRKAGCFVMEPSITTVMHAHGLNVRYLPYVLHRLSLAARPVVEHLIHVELVARAAKYVLQQDLCRTTTPQEARVACEAVLSALLEPTGAVSARFWRTRLGPVLQSHFDGIRDPFQLSVHALRAVAERMQELTGVWLSDASLASLSFLLAPSSRHSSAAEITEECKGAKAQRTDALQSSCDVDNPVVQPFVEIESIMPRTWVFPVPPHPKTAANEDTGETKDGTRVVPLKRRLGAMLLFWIGHTPDNADDRQQPFYLDESTLRGTG